MQRMLAVALLWVSVAAVGVAGGAPEPAQAPMSAALARGHGLLWKVASPGVAPSYVFGTIHIGDPRVTHLAPPVRQAFDHAASFSMEIRMDYQAYAQVVQGMFFHDGRTLVSVIGRDLFDRLAKVLAKRGLGRDTLMNMKPWAVMASAGLPGFRQGVALDLQLYDQAMAQHKKVYGLETPAEQLRIFEGLPHDLQVDMIRNIVEPKADERHLAQELLRAYLARDLNQLLRLGRQDLAGASPGFATAFFKRAVIDRNLRMVRRMQPRLREGNAFIAVGALHLPGPKGILHLLELRGYTVTPVY
ncbi:MAG: TraB/GumN family protein [Gammaproteobacteria bacterium]